MIYLSANGELLGQFEESAVPSLVSAGKIPAVAFYWREGMPEWRPVKDLAPAVAPRPAQAPPVARPSAAPAPTPSIGAAEKKTVVPRRTLVASAAVPANPVSPEQVSPGKEGAKVVSKADSPQPVKPPLPAAEVAKPFLAGAKAAVPRSPASVAARQAVPGELAQPQGAAAEPVVLDVRGNRRLVRLMALLLLAAAAGVGAWWFSRAPAAIPGRVMLAGDENGPVEIRVFGRDELAGAWREHLAAADARAAEMDKMMAEAEAVHRERKILYDEAAGVCAAGEEYNMPDVEELRADRDAKKAEADAARAEVERLQAEKGSLLSFEGLLQAVPAPRTTIVTDAEGNFLLPPPETGDAVLLATVSSGVEGGQALRGWLEVLEPMPDGAAPSAVQFAETNRLDVDEIRRFAAGE